MAHAPARSQTIAGRYRLRRPVGDGRMSTVYLADDIRRSSMPVAVKLLNTAHPDLLRRELFRRETQALERLEHDNIVRILDHGWSEEDSCFFVVLEWLESSLDDVIRDHRRDPNSNYCLPYMKALVSALVHAHSAGVVHRDIKPSNILFDAAGAPKLSDFGISRLQYELSAGMTVSGFWSIPYAPPEQRRGEAGDERSDIYALGVVFYQMLARQMPPADGPTIDDVAALKLPQELHDLLLRMLAPKPEDRPDGMTDVRRTFRVWNRQKTQPPEILLLITDRALSNLYNDYGVIHSRSHDAARDWLLEELTGDAQSRVPVTLDDKGNIRILGNHTSLFCERHNRLPILVIKAVDMPYLPNHEAAREAGKKIVARWRPISQAESLALRQDAYPRLAKTVGQLFDAVNKHNVKRSVKKERRLERRGFVETWEDVLRYQRRKLDEATQPLPFRSMQERDGMLMFDLKEAPPDKLNWPEGSVVAVAANDRERAFQVGELLGIEGTSVMVLREGLPDSTAETDQAGLVEGTISLYRPEESAALKRQSDALVLLRAGETVNPRLAEVLTDLQRATFDDPDESIEFVQSGLAPDKREAVRQALATRDLFLLQGPPGTGKTAAIAEMILQILKADPDAKILVSSQSNVAVNHALSRVAEAHRGARLEIIRLGRTEKISQGAEQWQLEQRQAAWRKEVVARCDRIREELSAEARKRSAEHKAAKGALSNADLQQCRDWLDEAGQALEALQESEEQYAALEEMALDAGQYEDDGAARGQVDSRSRSERVTLGEVIATQRQRLLNDLGVVRAFLPDRYQGGPLADPEAEIARLRSLIVDLSEPGAADDPAVKLRRLVQDWSLIFGIGPEFAVPLLKRANILAATCLFTGGLTLKDETFDWVIIDEAGRATAPELLVPLVRARRAILVGDERQLPPLLDEELAPEQLAKTGIAAENLERSLFETLVNEAQETCPSALRMLTVQHRMHPAIGRLISEVFYEGRLTHGVDPADRRHGLPWIHRPVTWFSTSHHGQHADERRGMSFANPTEVAVIEQLLRRMEADYRARGETREVGVIAGYMGQVADLADRLDPKNRSRWQALDIEVATVDAFQGRDRDIVIYSTVRSNPQGNLGFLRDRRRLNVSLSRAKELLVLVGDVAMFDAASLGGQNPFRDVLDYMRRHAEDCAIERWAASAPPQSQT